MLYASVIKYFVPLIPALVLFGPLFMVMGYDPRNHTWADIGAIMSGLGVAILFIKTMDQSKQIEELSRQLHEKR
jgi:hypothetical protein